MRFYSKIILTFVLLLPSLCFAKECTKKSSPISEIRAQGWGFDVKNTRFISSAVAKLDPHDISRLKLKWAFRFDGASKVRSQPAISNDTIYVGSSSGTLYALDRESGCIRWEFDTTWEIRTAISLAKNIDGRDMVFFGDFRANAFALDANNGELIWKKSVDEHMGATITGSPKFHDGTLYVPISSFEVALAGAPIYPCCDFRGAVAALDAKTGKIKWKTHVMDEASRQGSNAIFVSRYGPSGAPIWNSPTIDIKRNVLYVGTGENYSQPTSDSSDAVIAMDLDTGKIKWKRQLTANDAWNMACSLPGIGINCPDKPGKDLDVGASPILATASDGTDILLVGQKSSDTWGLNPDNGEVVWNKKLGRGGALGGIHWGMSVEGEMLFVPNSDYIPEMPGLNPVDPDNKDPKQPSLTALNIKTGNIIWQNNLEAICSNQEECEPALSAASTSIPGAVFAGSLDGHLRAYASKDGSLLWDVDTTREVSTVSGETGHGGSIDADGPVIVDGHVYINSGYGFFGELPGNVLLVYSIDGE
ncbi:MAG: PQQ-binding-like beta-propeller repeat protein [Pseudomonadales bacterium]|nr:PQQ-binding-like beta-propeller repeat protein [Pseudomonadales bacterium]